MHNRNITLSIKPCGLLLGILGLAVMEAGAENGQPVSAVSRVEVRGLSQPRKLTLLAAQDLANRTGPKVYLDFGADNRWMQMDYMEKPKHQNLRMWSASSAAEFQKKYPTINEAWIDILTKTSRLCFKPEP